MAEIVSRQAAKVAANTKMNAGEAGGKVSLIEITSPATVAWAQNDTIASPVILPVGTKILLNGYVSNAALTTSVTLDVGLRHAVTGAEVDLDGIATAVSVAAAGRSVLNNGALLAAGVAYVTTVPTVIVATVGGANPTDDAQLNIQILVVIPG
jgi:hypothetical protein